jgi:hypothetical protein
VKETVMRGLSLLLGCLVLGLALGLAFGGFLGTAAAQTPDPAADAPAPAADAPAPAGDAPAPAADASMQGDPATLRKTCVAAMNTNEGFARSIIQKAIDTDRVSVKAICADIDTVKTHEEAVAQVEENQRHVIAAYAAMWVIAALFLLYLLRHQQRLRLEIAQLRRDLDAAAKDGKDAT